MNLVPAVPNVRNRGWAEPGSSYLLHFTVLMFCAPHSCWHGLAHYTTCVLLGVGLEMKEQSPSHRAWLSTGLSRHWTSGMSGIRLGNCVPGVE